MPSQTWLKEILGDPKEYFQKWFNLLGEKYITVPLWSDYIHMPHGRGCSFPYDMILGYKPKKSKDTWEWDWTGYWNSTHDKEWKRLHREAIYT